MENRFAAQLALQSNDIIFQQHFGGFPQDSVTVVNPDRGYYGDIQLVSRTSRLNTVAASFEDRLKITPTFALIGGLRLEDIALTRNSWTLDGATNPGFPFSKSSLRRRGQFPSLNR